MKIHSIVKCIGETAFGFSIFHEVWSQDIEIRFRGPQFYFPICRWHEQQKCETKTKSISKNAQNFLASWILISDSPARFYLTLNFQCRIFFFQSWLQNKILKTEKKCHAKTSTWVLVSSFFLQRLRKKWENTKTLLRQFFLYKSCNIEKFCYQRPVFSSKSVPFHMIKLVFGYHLCIHCKMTYPTLWNGLYRKSIIVEYPAKPA